MPRRSTRSSAVSQRNRSRTVDNLPIQPPQLRSLRSRRSSAPRPIASTSQAQRVVADETAPPAVLLTSGSSNQGIQPILEEPQSGEYRVAEPPLSFFQPFVQTSSADLLSSGLSAAENYAFDSVSGGGLRSNPDPSLLPLQYLDNLNPRLLGEPSLNLDQQSELQDMRCGITEVRLSLHANTSAV